ncbi:hypothetical protein EJB05_14319 [Eragrostis curvula]|uniref:Uncharacterized protein n=1 Tax=Eragrostis curvula TaxID=38414 RepID=A0A5J9VX77_9POAL|nr:hypothetical protein EJB05_14319 [Eragrostis curvula]
MRSFASSSRAASPRDLLHACARLTPRANLSFASKVLRTTTTTIGECCSELATKVASQSERNTYVRFILAAISTMEIGGDESMRLKRSHLKPEDHLQAQQHGLQQAEIEREKEISESILGLNEVYNFDFDGYPWNSLLVSLLG